MIIYSNNGGQVNRYIKEYIFDSYAEYTTFIAAPESSIPPGSRLKIPSTAQDFVKLEDGTFVPWPWVSGGGGGGGGGGTVTSVSGIDADIIVTSPTTNAVIGHDTSKVDKLATPITPGTGTKVTYDAQGLIVSATTLSASDIPNIAISQVSGLSTILASTLTGTLDNTPDWTL